MTAVGTAAARWHLLPAKVSAHATRCVSVGTPTILYPCRLTLNYSGDPGVKWRILHGCQRETRGQGYSGPACATGPCSEKKCQNGGRCVVVNGTRGECICDNTQFRITGENCEIKGMMCCDKCPVSQAASLQSCNSLTTSNSLVLYCVCDIGILEVLRKRIHCVCVCVCVCCRVAAWVARTRCQ